MCDRRRPQTSMKVVRNELRHGMGEGVDDLGAGVIEGEVEGGAGGVGVSAAGEFLGDVVDVEVAAAAEADSGGAVFLFDEQYGDFDRADLLGFIDHVFDLSSLGAGLVNHIGGNVHDGEAVIAEQFEGLEHLSH